MPTRSVIQPANTFRRTLRGCVVVVGVGLIARVGVGMGPASAGVPFVGPSCPVVEQVAGHGAGWKRPVVLVHGVESSAARWSTPEVDHGGNGMGRTIVERLGGHPGVALYVFDYRSRSVNWVDDPDLGHRLAEAVICLSEGWNSSVDIVGHSMGGLLARWIADRPIPGTSSTVGERLGAVVTIGSPHEGSELLSAAAALVDGSIGRLPAPHALLARTLLAVCGRAAAANLDYCPIPKVRVIDSPAGRALRVGSAELAELTTWPEEISTHQIAGDARVTFGLFGRQLAEVGIGDGVVSVASAISGAGAPQVFQCTSGFTRVTDLMRAACMHSRLPQYQATLLGIETYLEATPPTWMITADSIGPVSLGMPIDELSALTGLSWVSERHSSWCTTSGMDSGGARILVFAYGGSGRVDSIAAFRPDTGRSTTRTLDGSGPGSRLDSVLARYGERAITRGGDGYASFVLGVDTDGDQAKDIDFFFGGLSFEGEPTAPADEQAWMVAVGVYDGHEACYPDGV